jgi:hypothetical protein
VRHRPGGAHARRGWPILAFVLAGGALAAPAAHALPGDDPITALTPDTGTTVAPDPNGLVVTYTCPVYRSAQIGDFPVISGRESYGAQLATAPTLGSDGRLLAGNVVAAGQASQPNTVPAGQCANVFGDGRSTGPQSTPGTYYWQAYRICTQCPGEYETTEVRTLVVRSAAVIRVKPGWTPYAGYPAPYALDLAGVPDGTAAYLQRRSGTAWKTIGSGTALEGAGEAIARLARGRHTLRVQAVVGNQALTSAPRTVTVRKAGRRRAARTGGWSGKGGVAFRVARSGREVRGFRARVTMVCPSALIGGQITTQVGFAQFRKAGVDPAGRFLVAATVKGSAVLVRGRLAAKKLSGGVAQLSVGTCTGSANFTARRRG